jgi:hypothetical protein
VRKQFVNSLKMTNPPGDRHQGIPYFKAAKTLEAALASLTDILVNNTRKISFV